MNLAKIAKGFEIFGGSAEVPVEWGRRAWFPVARGVYWLVLLLVVFAFAGRTTRFVYVDF
jgi:hypothetical protein